MNCFELIDRLIHPSDRVSLTEQYGRYMVILQEQECDSEAKIFSVPEGAIVLKLDENLDVGRLFSGSFGECKRSDFLLIAEVDPKIIFVHIEMKLTRGSAGDIAHQLRGSYCFVHYMKELGKAFASHGAFLNQEIHRFASIMYTGPRKRRTRIERATGQNDLPERAIKISSPHHIEFAKTYSGI
jgi:hypothetical protein